MSIKSLVDDLHRGLGDHQEYKLPYEFFAITERNLRLDALTELFARVDIPDLVSWLNNSHTVQKFMAEIYGQQETVDSKLNDFVSYRNEAAHGEEITQVMGAKEFSELIAFVEMLCDALAECVLHHITKLRLAISNAKCLGKVTEVFPIAKATVAIIDNCKLKRGQQILLLSKFACKSASIQSMQLNGSPVDEVQVSSHTEVGIKFEFLPQEGSQIVIPNEEGLVYTNFEI